MNCTPAAWTPATAQAIIMPMGDYTHIGGRLRQLRKRIKMTQEQLAAKAGCSYGYISHLELGRAEGWSSSMLVALADALDVEPWQLLGHDTPPSGDSSPHLDAIISRLRLATDDQLRQVAQMLDVLRIGITDR